MLYWKIFHKVPKVAFSKTNCKIWKKGKKRFNNFNRSSKFLKIFKTRKSLFSFYKNVLSLSSKVKIE